MAQCCRETDSCGSATSQKRSDRPSTKPFTVASSMMGCGPPAAATASGETIPVFDMMVIGVGDDGHVGSLYPNRDECTDDYSWCLPVEMKDPGSISLSLPVMRAAREVLVAACGVSEKYPQGKSDAMKRAVETEESVRDFPAAGLRDVAQYVFDEAAASKLTL